MRSKAFTLLEIMVSVVVLTILVVIVSRIVSTASTITTLGNKWMDTDGQVRPVFDRMAIDFAQMIKRNDVDYYVKASDTEPGNDRIAFFSQVAGYYPPSGTQSPISLVAYRINAKDGSSRRSGMERMGKGLLWTGVSPTPGPSPVPWGSLPAWLIFGPSGSDTLKNNWPSAWNWDTSNAYYDDPDYELIAPSIFRFEYFYLLKNPAQPQNNTLAAIPGGTGMQDVAAIVVVIAAIDPKSRVLLSNNDMDTLTSSLADFTTSPTTSTKISDLAASWQSTLDGITNMPRPAVAGIRIYQRTFYLWSAK